MLVYLLAISIINNMREKCVLHQTALGFRALTYNHYLCLLSFSIGYTGLGHFSRQLARYQIYFLLLSILTAKNSRLSLKCYGKEKTWVLGTFIVHHIIVHVSIVHCFQDTSFSN